MPPKKRAAQQASFLSFRSPAIDAPRYNPTSFCAYNNDCFVLSQIKLHTSDAAGCNSITACSSRKNNISDRRKEFEKIIVHDDNGGDATALKKELGSNYQPDRRWWNRLFGRNGPSAAQKMNIRLTPARNTATKKTSAAVGPGRGYSVAVLRSTADKNTAASAYVGQSAAELNDLDLSLAEIRAHPGSRVIRPVNSSFSQKNEGHKWSDRVSFLWQVAKDSTAHKLTGQPRRYSLFLSDDEYYWPVGHSLTTILNQKAEEEVLSSHLGVHMTNNVQIDGSSVLSVKGCADYQRSRSSFSDVAIRDLLTQATLAGDSFLAADCARELARRRSAPSIPRSPRMNSVRFSESGVEKDAIDTKKQHSSVRDSKQTLLDI